jgi:hypothetical protein
VNLLCQIEVAVANGKTTAVECKEAAITEQNRGSWFGIILSGLSLHPWAIMSYMPPLANGTPVSV